ncbi:Transposase [Desulforamulus aeronauticus DSM 10349]|uniref:Transposase n=1 Tax=Desulforamulus aeronauticus DSM 10349 TaxID=1121421 RepID=A0A1M6VZ86_9FIRM|nr:Transposase [Desulforamulus aeronauticus DSM 10349]
MKKSKFTEEQIAFALKQAELGTPVAEVIRKMGITSEGPGSCLFYYLWSTPQHQSSPSFLISVGRYINANY